MFSLYCSELRSGSEQKLKSVLFSDHSHLLWVQTFHPGLTRRISILGKWFSICSTDTIFSFLYDKTLWKSYGSFLTSCHRAVAL